MSNSTLNSKTVRPGSLNNYAYYYSNRRPPAIARPKRASQSVKSSRSAAPARPKLDMGSRGLLLVILVAAALIGLPLLRSDADPATVASSTSQSEIVPAPAKNNNLAAAQPLKTADQCAGNTEIKLVKMSVEKRRLWACEGTKLMHDTPIISGLRGHAETETPVGTYKVYGKMTDTRLTGQDSRGAWSYPVSYWMPFLDNQYGTYGFHDATWRQASEFGNISPDSDKASHGCVELPLASQKWLYDWAPVGTVVRVEA